MEQDKLTPQQIQNFREALSIGPIGIYALLMPEAELLKLHAKMQVQIDRLSQSLVDKERRKRNRVDHPRHHSGNKLGNIGHMFDNYKQFKEGEEL